MTYAEAVEQYMPLVKSIARKIHHATSSREPLDDLISDGVVGLLQAAKACGESHNPAFAAFARHRIRGEILDSITRRSAAKWKRDLSIRFTRIDLITCEPASDDRSTECVDDRDEAEHLLRLIPRHRDREIVQACVMHGRSNVDVARERGLAESTVSAIVSKAIALLRSIAKDQEGGSIS